MGSRTSTLNVTYGNPLHTLTPEAGVDLTCLHQVSLYKRLSAARSYTGVTRGSDCYPTLQPKLSGKKSIVDNEMKNT